MFKKIIALPLVACLLATTACADLEGVGTKQKLGALGGAAAGGLLGSQFGGGTGQLALTGLGVALGGLIGNSVGSSLDKADAMAMEQSTYAALNSRQVGKRVPWRNTSTGHSGYVSTINEGYSGGTYCREYQHTIRVGGKSQTAFGTACRQSDGSWQITS